MRVRRFLPHKFALALVGSVLVGTACGSAASPPSSVPPETSTSAPGAGSTSAVNSRSDAPQTAAQSPAIPLPPHGDLLYELKFGPSGSSINPFSSNAELNKVRMADDGVEFTAAPKGNAGVRLPGATADNFILSLRLRPVTGRGQLILSFRRIDGGEYPSLAVNTSSGGVAFTMQNNGRFLRNITQSVLKWPQETTDDVSLVVTALGSEGVVYINGNEAARTNELPQNKGNLFSVNANGPSDGDTPFISRLDGFQLFAVEASAAAALASTAAVPTVPHGDTVFELKATPPSANVTVSLGTKPGSKLQAVDEGVELQAAAGGGPYFTLPDVVLDNFVAEAEVRTVSGDGVYWLGYHGTTATGHAVYVNEGTGSLQIRRITPSNASTNQSLFGPELRLAPNAKRVTTLTVSAQGSDTLVYLDGKQAGKATDAATKGGIIFGATNGQDAKTPFVVRVRSLRVYQPAKPA